MHERLQLELRAKALLLGANNSFSANEHTGGLETQSTVCYTGTSFLKLDPPNIEVRTFSV